jgi:hypothetical protein
MGGREAGRIAQFVRALDPGAQLRERKAAV